MAPDEFYQGESGFGGDSQSHCYLEGRFNSRADLLLVSSYRGDVLFINDHYLFRGVGAGSGQLVVYVQFISSAHGVGGSTNVDNLQCNSAFYSCLQGLV